MIIPKKEALEKITKILDDMKKKNLKKK